MLIASVLRTVERRFEQISAIVTIKTRKKITAPTKVLNINNKVSSSVSPPSPSQKDFGAWGGFVETELGKVEGLLTVDVMLRALFSGHGISTASCSIAIAVSDALMFLEIVLASFGSFWVLQRLFTLAIFLISGELVDLKMVTVVVRGVADVAGMVVVLVANFVVEAVVIGGVGVVITVLFLVEAGVGVVGATVDLVVETVIRVVVVVVVVFVVVVLVVVGGAVVDPVVLGAVVRAVH